MEDRPSVSTASEFSVGSVFSRTLSTLFGKPVVFLGLALISLLPTTAIELLAIGGENFSIEIATQIILGCLSLFVQGATAYATLGILRNRTVSFGESLSRSTRRFGALFGTSLLASLSIAAASLLFLVPGIVLSCMWAVIIPACVVEGLGPGESMTRSETLTNGHRWKIFALITLLNISTIAMIVLTRLLPSIGILSFPGNEITTVLLSNFFSLFLHAFDNVMRAIMYYDLRATKEGVSVDSLANVFD